MVIPPIIRLLKKEDTTIISEAFAEERGCLETYGEEYREYLDKTPRWIGIPKSR